MKNSKSELFINQPLMPLMATTSCYGDDSSTSSISSLDESPNKSTENSSSVIAMRVAAKIHENASFLSPVQRPIFKDFVQTDDATSDVRHVRLLRKPFLTLQYFLQGICQCCATNFHWPWGRGVSLSAFSVFVLFLAVVFQAFEGEYGEEVQITVSDGCHMILEISFWIGCGIVATAGLGSGVQTGALVLFPHVCKVALEWAEQSDQQHGQEHKFLDLMWEVFMLGFWTGTGSAIGELVPYILARMIRAAGGDPFALLNNDYNTDTNNAASEAAGEKTPSASWAAVLISNTRLTMEKQMQDKSNVFAKIFILSAIPNALFDLCGLVCGSAGISFTTFFLAVFSGKALVRTPLQTCSLAALVAYFSRDNRTTHDDADDMSIRATVLRMGRNFVSKFLRGDETFEDGENDSTSTVITIIRLAW
eukprot:CAMPEP_0194235152 /NCGR_PEP_ID=MMETSP0158-20130606/2727_1 /TAXON_ID=33649 /ORGANISM="Thalassionema nitzschioides, Strain L26-B" /LENGTH=420 /DNA_ID=CAMNT_0038968551 /DNA_START=204 /DNA_END=1463 /DNA_ORIENTATION=-